MFSCMIGFELYPYQERLLADARAAVASGARRVLCVLPTGGGKTNVFITAASNAADRNRKSQILVHRRQLLHQTRARLAAAGVTRNVNVSTIGTRSPFVPDLLIIDECHHATSRTWQERIAEYDVPTLGFTATPERLDGRGLGEVFDAIVEGPTAAQLMAMGRLSGYQLFAPPATFNPKGVRMRGGDYATSEVAAQVDTTKAICAGVTNWQAYAPGRRTIAFCVSIAHAAHTCEAFQAAGVAAETIDSQLSDTEREARIERFKTGETTILVSVMLINEGFDVPACDCVLLLRPTASLALYLQMVGRGLRPSDQPCIILDCVGVSLKLGLPDGDRTWSLEGRTRSKADFQAPPVRQCPSCFQVHHPMPICPYCGFEHPPVENAIPPEVDVMLKLVEATSKRDEVRNARTEEVLRAIAKERGYKPGWVYRVLKARGLR